MAAVRRLGWVLVVTGSFLVILMTGITIAVARTIARPESEPGSHFTGTHADVVSMYRIFGLVIAVGLLSFGAGVWQVRTDRRPNPVVLLVMLLLVAALYMVARRMM